VLEIKILSNPINIKIKKIKQDKIDLIMTLDEIIHQNKRK